LSTAGGEREYPLALEFLHEAVTAAESTRQWLAVVWKVTDRHDRSLLPGLAEAGRGLVLRADLHPRQRTIVRQNDGPSRQQLRADIDQPLAEVLVVALPPPRLHRQFEVGPAGGHVSPVDGHVAAEVEDALQRVAEHCDRDGFRHGANEGVLGRAAVLVLVDDSESIAGAQDATNSCTGGDQQRALVVGLGGRALQNIGRIVGGQSTHAALGASLVDGVGRTAPTRAGVFQRCPGGGPAGEELEGVVGGRARLGGVGGEGEAFVGFDGHGLEHEVEVPDGWVAEVLEAGAVQADVVGCPEGAEFVAAGG